MHECPQCGFIIKESSVEICPNCKKEVTHGLPITAELFNPSN